jgi:hypothetical protein
LDRREGGAVWARRQLTLAVRECVGSIEIGIEIEIDIGIDLEQAATGEGGGLGRAGRWRSLKLVDGVQVAVQGKAVVPMHVHPVL